MGCDSNLRTYTFEQNKFKKEFAIMNQVFRQNAQISVEKVFYKFINNSKFGYNCRNNTDNCTFAAIFDEIEKLSDAKRFQNVFDQEISEFFSIEFFDQQIEEECNNKITSLDLQDKYFEGRKNSLEFQKLSSIQSSLLKKSRQKK